MRGAIARAQRFARIRFDRRPLPVDIDDRFGVRLAHEALQALAQRARDRFDDAAVAARDAQNIGAFARATGFLSPIV